ncbi:MAG: hypothetical protein ABIR18_16365 [Chitinophagaceae bacterium]
MHSPHRRSAAIAARNLSTNGFINVEEENSLIENQRYALDYNI